MQQKNKSQKLDLQPYSNIFIKAISFLKNWTLPISLFTGVLGFYLTEALPLSPATRHSFVQFAEVLQPTLIFSMLFLACCKIDYRKIRFLKWQYILLGIQLVLLLIFLGAVHFTDKSYRLVLESAMLCIITPTATAATVVASKLKGDAMGVITYTMLSNLLVAIVFPFSLSFLNLQQEFWNTFYTIALRTFPILVCPFLLAIITREFIPWLSHKILHVNDLPFYLWCLCLPLSIALAMKTLHVSNISFTTVIGIAIASLLICILSFTIGTVIGRKYQSKVAGAQSLGQKNSAFAIWLAYMFLPPVVSLTGGFYAIWQNLYNAWQLAKQRKEEKMIIPHSSLGQLDNK